MTTKRKLGNQKSPAELTESLHEVLSLNFICFLLTVLQVQVKSLVGLLEGLEQLLHPHPHKDTLHSSLWFYFYMK